MQQPRGQAPFAMPSPAGQAYANIIRRTESPRDIEYRVFAKITAELQDANRPDGHFATRIAAVHRNRELWQTLAFDLADDGNMLPAELRAKLISLAIWVTKESARINKEGGSLEALINVNQSIMQGLRPSATGLA